MDLKNITPPDGLLKGQLMNLSHQKDVMGSIAGKNTKKVLIVLADIQKDNPLFQYLTKIVAAVDLDIEKDVGLLILTNNDGFSFSKIVGKMTIETAIFFDVSPRRAGLNINYIKYQWLFIQNRHLLFADDLATIQDSKDLRMALWNALKSLFK